MPSQPGKEFEIQKRLDRLRDNNDNNNNDNDNSNNDNDSLFPPGPPASDSGSSFGPRGLSPPPPPPNISNPFPEEYDLQQRLNQENVASNFEIHQRFNNLRNPDFVELPPFFANNAPTFNLPHLLNHQVLIDRPRVLPRPSLFGPETQALTREKAK